jgi:hypothetical protein
MQRKKVPKNQAKVTGHLTVQPWTEDLSMDEEKDVIVKLKNHKAPGEDTISTELIKHRGLTLLKIIH